MNDPRASDWYALTKLRPPLVREQLVHRPDLERALVRSVRNYGLTLLSAPAGYGKTTLLSSLPVLLPDYPVAWVTIDEDDNDPVRFVGLIAASLEGLHPQCGRSVWPRISGGMDSPVDVKKAVVALINDIVSHLREPFILVLDDLHYATNPVVFHVLDYLLDQRPSNLRVAVGTRLDPPIRLSRLAERGQVGELRRSDLSLTSVETEQLLNGVFGFKLSSTEIAVLQNRTEGWPGALCLLAGALGRLESAEGRIQFLVSLVHSEKRVFDFLADEIVLSLPNYIREFMLKTSILSEVTSRACTALTGRQDSDAILSELYRRNLVIAVISDGEGDEPLYRYHALFGRLLNEQLQQQYPAEVAELHRRAAEIEKTPGRSISHYLSARLWERAIELILHYGMQMLYQGMAETIRQWYQRIPREIRGQSHRLTVLMARCDIHRGDYKSAKVRLKKVLEESNSAEDRGDALTSLITLAYQDDDRTAAQGYVEQAIELHLHLRPIGRIAVGLAGAWLEMSNRNWAAAATRVRDSLAIPTLAGDRWADLVGITYTTPTMAFLPDCMSAVECYSEEVSRFASPDTAWYLGGEELGAWFLLWKGRVKEAQVKAEKAEALREKLGGYPFVGNDLPILLGILHSAQGNWSAVASALGLLVQRIGGLTRSKSMLHLHAAGRFAAQMGRSAQSLALLRELRSLDSGHPLTSYLILHLDGLNSLLGNEHAKASAFLHKAIALEDDLPIAHVGGSARLLYARLLLSKGQSDEALCVAESVFQRWNKMSLLGMALLDGPVIVPLLRHACGCGVEGVESMLSLFSEASPLQAQFHPQDKPDDVVIDLLSTREIEVLRLVAAGFTNARIGAELHISPETVKSHMVSIFQKLSVNSRTQAAVRAKELGI